MNRVKQQKEILPLNKETFYGGKLMNTHLKMFLIILSFLYMNCNNRTEVEKLLKSNNKEDIILGSYKAGEMRAKNFVPLLLENAYDERMSTNIRFKGITVYQAKMIALKKILQKEPPVKITYIPDSAVISFYKNLSEKEN